MPRNAVVEQILDFIQSNVHMAPYAICFLLLLAGFNLPISEDLMLFISGILAAQNPDKITSLFLGVFLGSYVGDVLCFQFYGRYLGDMIFETKFFSKPSRVKKMKRIEHFYQKYGIITLFIGRFIPFGVRNALFISAGLAKMNPWKFAISDFLSCLISTTTYFWLYKTYGTSVLPYIKRGNVVFICIVIFALIAFVVAKKRKTG